MPVHKKGQSEFTYNACAYRQMWGQLHGRVAPCAPKLATRDKERKGGWQRMRLRVDGQSQRTYKLLPANRLTQLLSIPQWDRSIEMTVGVAMASGTEIYTLVGHPALTRRSVVPGLGAQGRRVSETRCRAGSWPWRR